MDPSTEARCVLHPDQTATEICARCGNFACAACTESGQYTHCPTCRGSNSFPLRRDTWTFDALWTLVWGRFQKEWVMLSVVSILMIGASFIVSSVGQVFQVTFTVALKDEPTAMAIAAGLAMFLTQVVGILVQGIMGLGTYRICIDVLQGRPVDLGQFPRQARKLWLYVRWVFTVLFVTGLPLGIVGGLIGVVIYGVSQTAWGGHLGDTLSRSGGGAVLVVLVVLAIIAVAIGLGIALLPLALCVPEMAAQDQVGAWGAIRNSFALARGERLRIFGVMLVSGACTFAGVLACCIGMIPAMGLSYLLITGLYLSLRTGMVEGAIPATWSPEDLRPPS